MSTGLVDPCTEHGPLPAISCAECIAKRRLGIEERVVNRLYWAVNPTCTEEQMTMARYWVHPQILVGGSIQSREDWDHIRFGLWCFYVLSVESERDDVGTTGDAVQRARFPFEDSGGPISASILGECHDFAAEPLRTGACLYVHCQGGGSRSPAIAYYLMRTVFHKTAEESLAAIRVSKPGYGVAPWSSDYIGSIERVLGR